MKHASDNWKWLSSVETIAIDGEFEQRTGEVETLLVVLSGTFDMVAGGGSWPARGLRSSPFEGKPVALFLPPDTTLRLSEGSGEILLVSGVQPTQKLEVGEATSRKPLLAMAGSGKAFDPKTGEWKNQEFFPSSPQALLPRHIAEDELPGAVRRRVFPTDFKSLCLSLDEIVLTAGANTGVPTLDLPDYPEEMILYHDAPGGLVVDGHDVFDRGWSDITAASRFTAIDADAYLAIAYAGPKLPPQS